MAEPVFEVGALVRLKRNPAMEGHIVAVYQEGGNRFMPPDPNAVWRYRTSFGEAVLARQIELVEQTPETALIDRLEEDLSAAMAAADIDGYGDEGAGYNWRITARELLKHYDITPKEV